MLLEWSSVRTCTDEDQTDDADMGDDGTGRELPEYGTHTLL